MLQQKIPEYVDGRFELYKIVNEKTGDFNSPVIQNEKMTIWYREIAVFDRTRIELQQHDKEVTMKVRIPQYKGISSDNVCIIDGVQHKVFNAAHLISKEGYPETELTLINPVSKYEVKS